MKKFLIFAACAVALFSCNKDEIADNGQNNSEKNIVRTVTLNASFENVDTKASLGSLVDGKMPFLWNTNDAVRPYVGIKKLANDLVVAEAYNNTKSAVFELNFEEGEIPVGDEGMIFFYPAAKGDATISSAGLSFTFPESQYAVMNGLPADRSYNKLAAAIAYADNAQDVYDGKVSKLEFKNVFAVVQFSLDETLADVMEFALIGNNNEVLSGTYDIASDASITIDETMTSYKEAKLAYDSQANFATGSNYYLILAPTVFEKGFTVRLKLADGTVLTKTSPEKKYDFARSSVNGLGTLTKSAFTASLKMTELWKVANTNPRNLAIDKDYVYVVGANATNLKAYSLADGTETTMSVAGIDGGMFKTCDVKVMDNNGSSVVLVCNLATAGSVLKIYKYSSLTAVPEVALSYTVTSGRLGDKFSVDGNWQSGKLIFHDASGKNKAYVFSVSNGEISSTPTEVTYTSSLGTYGAFYRYGNDGYLWAGVNKNSLELFDNSLNQSSTAVTISESATAIHGLRFFTLYSVDYMTYLQVISSTSASLHICSLANRSDISTAIKNAAVFETVSYTTVGNGNAVGDVAVYSDGYKAYVASLATGLGFSLYETKLLMD